MLELTLAANLVRKGDWIELDDSLIHLAKIWLEDDKLFESMADWQGSTVVESYDASVHGPEHYQEWKIVIAGPGYDHGLISDDYDTRGETIIDRDHVVEFHLLWHTPINVRCADNTKYMFVNGEVLVQRWFVNIYEIDRCYGGAEEGGWYFDTGEIRAVMACISYEEAKELQQLMQQQYPQQQNGSRNWSGSVLYEGGDYSIRVQKHEGQDYPNERPHYS